LDFGNHEQTLATIIGSGIVQIVVNLLNQRKEAQRAEAERQIKAAEIACKLEEERLEIAKVVALRTAELAAENERHLSEIKQKIDQNTEISVKAFDAANHVDERMAAMLKDHTKQESIDSRTKDIQGRVIRIEDTIVPNGDGG
jgi:Rad3-related DNA helicase